MSDQIQFCLKDKKGLVTYIREYNKESIYRKDGRYIKHVQYFLNRWVELIVVSGGSIEIQIVKW